MKKLFVILASGLFLACGGGDKTETGKETTTGTEQATTSEAAFPEGITQADYDNGMKLVLGSDCLSCHKINELHTGPSYKDIAQKYDVTDANITMLADKIIKGGSGNWGQVPMTAHDSLSVDDAKTMVKYVLSLKNMK